MHSPFALAATALLFAGCDAGGDGPPVSYCNTSTDCPSSMVCEFPASAGCSAQGECAAPPAESCAPQEICSCAGATVPTCLVGAYAVGGPIRALGSCGADGSGDAGADAGSDAATD